MLAYQSQPRDPIVDIKVSVSDALPRTKNDCDHKGNAKQDAASRMVMIKMVSAKPVGRRELGPVEDIGSEATAWRSVSRERNVLG